jgi:hypothetical protein
LDVPALLKRTADKIGFDRGSYLEKNIPNNVSDITVFLFLGDIRSSFILSSLLIKRYREEIKGSKYFIICTWPGFNDLFPFANEVWTIREESILKNLYATSHRFENHSELLLDYRRSLNWVFEDVQDASVLKDYYDDGINQLFWDVFKFSKRTLLNIPSATILGEAFNRELIKRPGYKVMVYPSIWARSWKHGLLQYIKTDKMFWFGLIERLLLEGITPVVYNNAWTHDVSPEFTDRCIYFSDKSVLKVMGAMRAVGCVIDVFSGIDRWAIEARAPFISVDERARYNGQKEMEIDGICCEETLPRKYIFLFPTIIDCGDKNAWKSNIYDAIISKLLLFLPSLDRTTWPSMTEKTETVLYEKVSQRKMKKLGVKFIKLNKELIDDGEL